MEKNNESSKLLQKILGEAKIFCNNLWIDWLQTFRCRSI